MKVIDDDGRLFGLVNVIDALVVLLVVAVAVAGVALLEPFQADRAATDTGELTTRYATVDFGSEPRYLATQLEPGDQMQPRDWNGNATVTDVYRVPAGGSNVSTVARIELEGKFVEAEKFSGRIFTFAGERISPGSSFQFDTRAATLAGTVEDLARDTSTLETSSTSVVIEKKVPAATANAIQSGDVTTVAGTQAVTVEEVAVYPTNESNVKRVHVGVSLSTLEQDGVTTFGGESVKIGTPLNLGTSSYDLHGTVIDRGQTQPSGERVTRTVELAVENVTPGVARAVEPELTEASRGTTYAHVVDAEVRPARVILTSESGQIYEREHPRRKDVNVTVELTARRTSTGLWFHGRPLQRGSTITLDLGTVTVRGEVVGVRES